MEIPIQVAVRICPKGLQKQQAATNLETLECVKREDQSDNNGNLKEEINKLKCNENEDDEDKDTKCCIQTIPLAATQPGYMPSNDMIPGVDNGVGIAAGLVQVGPHSFPVTHALPLNCAQNQVYHQTVFPLISLFMEGFDASVVSYGQKGCGKTYTLYGYGFDCSYSEADQGIVQRCVREIFTHMTNHPERTYAVNIGWVEICGEVIRDLLGVGNVHCMNFADVFHWLQVGAQSLANSKMEMSHTLFTLTLEQQWVSKEGLIQHRLSTASFSDLCATERLFMLNSLDQPSSLPKDLGLQSLEHVVNTLTDPALMYNANGNIPYNQTTLTTLLKDSFGGRAQTLVILCVSPFERDINETLCNLQFGFKVQCVRNYVVMNTFSDDNTPLSPEGILPELGGGGITTAGLTPPVPDSHFGLQFAASQWFKLVSNAEGLFSKLISSNAINDAEKEQIEEWLFLKQECEECLSSNEVIRSQKQLGPIQEADEPEETNSEPETSCQQNSDNESDSESQRPDLEEKIELLMEDLSIKTDKLVKSKYQEFMENHPKAVMESQESFQQRKKVCKDEEKELEERRQSVGTGGRRRSIQPGATLSSAEIAMLNRVAGVKQQQAQQQNQQQLQTQNDDFLDSSSDVGNNLRQNLNTPIDIIQKKLRKLDTDIEARLRQIKEVEETMQLKQNIITDLIKNSDTRTTAKQRFHKKRAKLETEYEKTKKSLAKAMVQQKDKQEIERLKAVITHLEQRLNDVTSIKHIAGESGQKVKKLQQSLHESKKLIDDLQKKIKKERKLKEALENELKALKEKENSKALVKIEHHQPLAEEKGKHLKEVQARISHLDHVLKEKSDNLDLYRDDEQREGLRHEIRNLRRTRDHLLEQRCSLDRKLKRDKMLSRKEERKLLECDEAIEAIDAAIEFKNELICGHKSIDTSERLQREKGEQMLMARLNKLSTEEMRTLLYKYFTKVIDLRDSSRKLELQLMQLEREKDAWEWKERVLSNAVRQARLEGERNAVLLQRQHEMKLTLMLRHLADETSNSSASFSEQSLNAGAARYYKPTPSHLALQTTTNSATSCFTDSDYEWATQHNNHNSKMLKPSSSKLNDLEMCPLTDPTSLTKYKPLDKFKDKERETKNKLFAKFQVLTRYAASHHNHHQQQQQHKTAKINNKGCNLVNNGNKLSVSTNSCNRLHAGSPHAISPKSSLSSNGHLNKYCLTDISRRKTEFNRQLSAPTDYTHHSSSNGSHQSTNEVVGGESTSTVASAGVQQTKTSASYLQQQQQQNLTNQQQQQKQQQSQQQTPQSQHYQPHYHQHHQQHPHHQQQQLLHQQQHHYQLSQQHLPQHHSTTSVLTKPTSNSCTNSFNRRHIKRQKNTKLNERLLRRDSEDSSVRCSYCSVLNVNENDLRRSFENTCTDSLVTAFDDEALLICDQGNEMASTKVYFIHKKKKRNTLSHTLV